MMLQDRKPTNPYRDEAMISTNGRHGGTNFRRKTCMPLSVNGKANEWRERYSPFKEACGEQRNGQVI